MLFTFLFVIFRYQHLSTCIAAIVSGALIILHRVLSPSRKKRALGSPMWNFLTFEVIWSEEMRQVSHWLLLPSLRIALLWRATSTHSLCKLLCFLQIKALDNWKKECLCCYQCKNRQKQSFGRVRFASLSVVWWLRNETFVLELKRITSTTLVQKWARTQSISEQDFKESINKPVSTTAYFIYIVLCYQSYIRFVFLCFIFSKW